MSVAAHFADEAQQAHAARLGMWVFLASELLLFAGLFALWAGYREHDPAAFAAEVRRTDLALGSANTFVLLTASFAVVAGVRVRRRVGFSVAIALGLVFLALKAWEWRDHVREGLVPGRDVFWTLYYAATGLHALHVIVGMTVLGSVAAMRRPADHVVENAANYWHLVDVIWLFLWPAFYLARG